jgi:hypothetical protein
MAFILELDADRNACPRFQCDNCKKTIANARGAWLLWDSMTRQNDIVTPITVCRDCGSSYPNLPFSMELDKAFIRLIDNCAMTEGKLKALRKKADLLASIT